MDTNKEKQVDKLAEQQQYGEQDSEEHGAVDVVAEEEKDEAAVRICSVLSLIHFSSLLI